MLMLMLSNLKVITWYIYRHGYRPGFPKLGLYCANRSKMYNAASRSAESVSSRRTVRLRSLVFALLQYSVGLGQRFVAGRCWVVGGLDTRRGNVVGSVLEFGHLRYIRADIIVRVCGHGECLASMLFLHQLHLGLVLDLGLESGLSVGVDGLLCEVVRSAASWWMC